MGVDTFDKLNDSIMLPFMVPAIPEITNTGLFEIVAKMVAFPKAKIWGGKLVSETDEFGGHENPSPRSVIVQVEMLLVFFTETNNNTLRCTPETDAIGADNHIRLTVAQVVSKWYWKLGCRVNS